MSALIGIVSKNRSAILPKALDSALMQTYHPLEVAVSDDNSSDGTALLKERYPSVTWEFFSESKGLVFARNKFMSETIADYFCSIDDDSWFLERATLSTAVEYLNGHPETAVVAFDILSADRPQGLPKAEPFEVANFIGCGHLIRIKAVREVGYYQPFPFFYGAEEKELTLRLINAGYKVMYLPGEYVWHDKTVTARDPHAQYRSAVCNDLVFGYRSIPGVFVIPSIIFKIGSHLIFSVRMKDKGYLGLWKEAVSKFLSLVFTGKLKRMPVGLVSFIKFNRLNKKRLQG